MEKELGGGGRRLLVWLLFPKPVNFFEYTADEDADVDDEADADADDVDDDFPNMEARLFLVPLPLFDDWFVLELALVLVVVTLCVSFSLMRGFDRASSNGDLYDANDMISS